MTGASHRTSSHFVIAVGELFVAFNPRQHAFTHELHRARVWRTETGARRWLAANAAALSDRVVVIGTVANGAFVPLTAAVTA